MTPFVQHLLRGIGVAAMVAGLTCAALAEDMSGVRRAAESGDSKAQRDLAEAFENGSGGMPVDVAAAEHWYAKAAEAGDREAQSRYGRLLFSHDRTAALPWLIKAADKGDARAAYIAGTALFNGDGGRKDWAAAYAYMTLAANAGIAAAKSSLAQMTPLIDATIRQEAQQRLAKLQPSSNPVAAAKPRPTSAAPEPAVAASQRPSGKRLVSAGRGVTNDGPYFIQFGAYSGPSAAKAAWHRVASSLGDALGKRAPTLVAAGPLMRLRLTHLDRDTAHRLCPASEARDAQCFVGRDG